MTVASTFHIGTLSARSIAETEKNRRSWGMSGGWRLIRKAQDRTFTLSGWGFWGAILRAI